MMVILIKHNDLYTVAQNKRTIEQFQSVLIQINILYQNYQTYRLSQITCFTQQGILTSSSKFCLQ